MSRLAVAAFALTALDVAHALDHGRQGRKLTSEVYALGIGGWVALAVLLALVLTRSRWAPAYAALVGASVLVGFALVHLAPHWSALSDPYSAFHPDALSWAAVVAPMLAATWLARLGLADVRDRRRSALARPG